MTRNWPRTVLAGAIALAPFPTTAQTAVTAVPAVTVQSPADTVELQLPIDAAMQDAAEYARRFGVPLDEAMRRMRAQAATVPVTDALRTEFADRLAGIAIDHSPAYRITVLLTGTDAVAERSVTAGGMVVPILFRTGAAAPLGVMIDKVRTAQADIRATLPHPPGIGVDQRTGEIIVMVATADLDRDRDGALSRRFAAMTGVPVRIEAVDRPPVTMALQTPVQSIVQPLAQPLVQAPDIALRTPSAAIPRPELAGGGRVIGTVEGRRYVCTTGFLVTDGVRSAIATAAHCPDALGYVGRDRRELALPYAGQWGWGYQDVQINLAPVASDPVAAPGQLLPPPAFYADTAKTRLRTVATWRNRTSTRAGDFVCHRGERTGYSCAPVAMVDFAPAGDLCGGACLPTWVAVEGPTCKSGDSGAPVFEGQVALGLVKGGTYRADGSCVFYYYMSTDYLPTGWTLAYR